MSDDRDGWTVASCFAELRPGLDELAHLVRAAPLPERGRTGLAMLVAAHAFGLAASAMGKDATANAREVADMIVETMRYAAPKPRLVADAADLDPDAKEGGAT